MSTDRPIQIDEFSRLATAWLAEGPVELNDHVLDAALANVHVTGQRRPFTPWSRPTTVPRSQAAMGLVALSATLVALVVGGAYLFSRPPRVGPASSPTPSTPPSATPFPANVFRIVPFTSPQYGYTVEIPSDWSLTTATSDWHPTSDLAPLGTPTADVFVVGDASTARRAEIVAEAQPGGTTAKQWTDRWEALREVGGHCFGSASPWTDVTVVGLAARTFSWRCNDSLLGERGGDYDEYVFLASGKGFVISGAPSIVQQLVVSFAPPPVVSGPTPITSVWPHAEQIAFLSNRDQPRAGDIYLMDADGSNVRRLTTDPALDWYPAWSPDGGRIAFVRGSDAAEIWVMNADGGDQRQLTHAGRQARRPTWSPDGSRIAFVDATRGSLLIADVGSGSITVADEPTAGGDADPAWSPDGQLIAFTNGGVLYTVTPLGQNRQVRIGHVDPTMRISQPALSPVGTDVADVIAGSIWLESWTSSGSGGSNLTLDLGIREAAWPSWTTAGHAIVFSAQSNACCGSDLYRLGVDGRGFTRLTHSADQLNSQPAVLTELGPNPSSPAH